jgi:hypothetical protein
MAIKHVQSEVLQAAVAAVESKLTPAGEPAPTPEDVIGQEAEAIAAEEKLEVDTQTRLDTLFKPGEETDTDEEDDSTPEPGTTEGEPAPAKEKTDEAEPTPVKPEAEAKPSIPMPEAKPAEEPVKPAETTVMPLPDAYVRAAIHQGWTEQEVKDQYKANPELTTRTLGKLYESTNKLSKDFAALGRAKKAAPASAPTPMPAPVVPAAPVADPLITKLQEAYGDDPIVDVVKDLKAKLTAYESKATEPAPASEQPVNTEAMTAIRQEVNTFFTNPAMKSYSEFYGDNVAKLGDKTWDGISDEQKAHRWEVLGVAQDILVGAAAQGRAMDVPEAMEKAHLIVSEPVRTKVVRNDLMAQVVKRAKGMTLKPSSVVGQDADASNIGALKPHQVEANAASRLAKMNW